MWRDAPVPIQKVIGTPLRIAGRVMETVSEPLMGVFVPRAKAGVFAALAENWERQHPNATPEERSAAMIRFQDSVDNRMGQLRYDNLFWNKTLKDLAFVMMRSVGWNLGTVREIGGSAVDAGKFVTDVARGRAPAFTTRMAYTMAMPMVVGLYGSLLTYLATGKPPQQMLDYFFPPTGNTDENGQVERRMIPSYVKDVIDYMKHPIQTALNKTHPLLETGAELVSNRDFRHGSIYDPTRDRGPIQAYGDYLINQAIPFSWRGWSRLNADKAPMLDQMLAFWGIQAAPKAIVAPEREEAFQRRDDAAAYRRRMKESDRINILNSPAAETSP
jgi:hypothetical protein